MDSCWWFYFAVLGRARTWPRLASLWLTPTLLGPVNICLCNHHVLGSGDKAAGSQGGAGTCLIGAVCVCITCVMLLPHADPRASSRHGGPGPHPPNSPAARGCCHPVSQIRKWMDLVRFGSQMFQLFHKQQVPLIVCKHLINSQQTPQVGLPFGGGGGVLDFSSFHPLMRG